MRKILVTVILSYLYIGTSAQIIDGYVFDEKTKRKISNAIVYTNGTFCGTNSDYSGYFSFDISGYPSMPVTISSAGYYSVSFDVVTPEKPVEIFLKPKIYESMRAEGTSKDKQTRRDENLKLFKKSFLGETRNARYCEILNEDDIIFITDQSDTLKAFASGPILLHNKALGYKTSYYLDEFALNRKDDTFFFSGNIFFNEDLLSAGTDKKSLVREQVYQNSRMCFFRSLWSNKLDSAGYVVKNAADEDLGYDKIVVLKDNTGKYLKHFEYLNHPGQKDFPSTYIIFREKEVYYDSWGRLDRSSITEIILSNDVYFDRNGYFDPSEISWRGKLANQRIADMLPLEFKSKKLETSF